ncbi:hypothetical protein N7468_001659 [Penicillium chermesinum]|uniref:Uncharacterized protein n=1 Tax=Penicillium chermesinum TaxID=63820 RepID=A0A9W9PGZ0_9EURO|nr:uncharacterized protein N7468_001659 [Penicillium chermesinum]KAJ5246676.1 hypothetical protein N7468_001659 [Penicillium chermesinum]
MSHEQEPEQERDQHDPWYPYFHPPTPPPSYRTTYLPPPRMAGDGLDYRRPMNTTSQGASELDIIDLTNEPESPPQVRRQQGASNSSRAGLPRFERNILNDAPQEIVNLDDDEADDDHGEGPSSPDVLFVGESTRPRPPTSTLVSAQ